MKKSVLLLLLVTAMLLIFAMPVAAADWTGYTAVSSASDLDNIRNNLSGKYYLTNDIVFTEADFDEGGDFYNGGSGWIPLGDSEISFTGTFDGNGYTISGLEINTELYSNGCWHYVGIFGFNKGKIQNVGVVDISILGKGSISGYIGGIVGYNHGIISNCYNQDSIVDNDIAACYSGGIAGANDGAITSCNNTGEVCSSAHESFIGGIVGQNNLTGAIKYCYNTGDIVSSANCEDTFSGGIAGFTENGTIANCHNTGNISTYDYGQVFIGGIVGAGGKSVENCNNEGVITVISSGTSVYAGGIIGYQLGNYYLTNCSNSGNVSVEIPESSDVLERPSVGGIVGRSNSIITNCNNNGDISATSSSSHIYVGGVTGFLDGVSLVGWTGMISECCNEGVISAVSNAESSSYVYVGGVTGRNTEVTVESSYNAGDITVQSTSGAYTGGVVGYSDGTVTDCYNVGSLSSAALTSVSSSDDSENNAITSSDEVSISSVYSSGGIAGFNDTTVSNCYYLNTIGKGVGNETGGTISCTSTQMQAQNTYSGFDFNSVWYFDSESTYLYPQLLNTFEDVPQDAYYFDAVKWAKENGVTSGTSDTTFSPSATCTRGQCVTFLWRAAGEPEPKSTVTSFTDVSSDAYYYKAVLWAVENNITSGTSATTFSPNAKVSRAQVVTFQWRMEGEPQVTTANVFSDVSSDAYYYNAVLWAVEHEITHGTTATTFSPNNSCTRGQIVTFLYRYFK